MVNWYPPCVGLRAESASVSETSSLSHLCHSYWIWFPEPLSHLRDHPCLYIHFKKKWHHQHHLIIAKNTYQHNTFEIFISMLSLYNKDTIYSLLWTLKLFTQILRVPLHIKFSNIFDWDKNPNLSFKTFLISHFEKKSKMILDLFGILNKCWNNILVILSFIYRFSTSNTTGYDGISDIDGWKFIIKTCHLRSI